MTPFSEAILGIPWTVLAALAVVVAVIFVFIDTSGATVGWRWLILRWFHPLCWLLLAAAALAKARFSPLAVEWAPGLAAGGGVLYALFILTTLLGRA